MDGHTLPITTRSPLAPLVLPRRPTIRYAQRGGLGGLPAGNGANRTGDYSFVRHFDASRGRNTATGCHRQAVFAFLSCRQTTGAPAKPIEELCLPKDDVLRVQGIVTETLPNAMFSVQIDGGLKVLARASGKMRRGRFIRILPGDRVDVELSAYDPSRGRIVWRYK